MKKCQAALEFLMTYGWAILVVLVAVIALSYFGVLSPDYFLPNKCILVPGLACSDFKAGSNAVQIVLANSLGEDITIKDIDIKDCQSSPSSLMLRDSQKATFTMGLCTFAGMRYSSEVNVTYTGESGLEHKVKGEIIARVEGGEISYDYLGAGAGSGQGSFSGLVAAYDFNENDGFTLTDKSGNGNDGTIYGNTILLMNFDDGTADDKSVYNNDGAINGADCGVAGKSGKGCSFDGIDDYIKVDVASPANFTATAWIKLNTVATKEQTIFGIGSTWALYTDFSSIVNAGDGWSGIQPLATGLEAETWYHVAYVKEGNKALLYINGAFTGERTKNDPVGTFENFGIWYNEVNDPLNGTIDEAAIYSKALSQEEIQRHYNANKAKFTDWESGKYGSALGFDGVDDRVVVNEHNSLDFGTGNFTIEAWVYSKSSQDASVIGKGAAGNADSPGYTLAWRGTEMVQFYVSDSADAGAYAASNAASLNAWHHIAAVADRSVPNSNIYINGVKVSGTGNPSEGDTSNNNDLLIAGDTGAWGGEYFNGLIDSVAIYNRALTEEEIALHAGS